MPADRHGSAARRARSGTRSRSERPSTRSRARARRTSPSSCSTPARACSRSPIWGSTLAEGRTPRRGGGRGRLGDRGVRALDPGAGRRPRSRRAPDGAGRPRGAAPLPDGVVRLGALAIGHRSARARGGAAHEGGRHRPRGRRRLLARSVATRSPPETCSPRCTRATRAPRPPRSAAVLGGVRDRRRAAARARDPARRRRVAACPSFPRSRRSGAARAAARGPDARASRDPRPTADAAVRPLRGRRGARGRRASSAVERRGKYLLVRFESGLGLLVHLRMTGSFGFAPVAHERAVVRARRRLAARVPRRPPLRNVARARRAPSSSRTSRRRTGPSRSARASRARWLGGAARAAAGAAQGRAARPARRRRPREHLRGRGAVARAAQSAAARGRARLGDEVARLTRAIRAALRAGHRAAGLDAARLRAARRRVRLDAGRVPRLRPRRRAVSTAAAPRSRRPVSAAVGRGSARAASRQRGSRIAPTGSNLDLSAWGARTRPRQWCSGRSGSARPTASSTSTRSIAVAWAPSRRGSARRSRASVLGSSRSRTSSSLLHQGLGRAPHRHGRLARRSRTGRSRGSVPALGRARRRRGDAAPLRRGGAERARVRGADAIPHGGRRPAGRLARSCRRSTRSRSPFS